MTTDTASESPSAGAVPRSRWRRRILWVVGILVALVLAAVLAFTVTPWPGSMVVRFVFDRGAAKTTSALEKHAPQGIASITDQQYRDGDPDALLDVYFPESTTAPLPAVIWTHGGAWISGDKSHYSPYYQLLAERGFTVVSLDYSLGPEHTYPTAVHQLNDAHAYVLANAERLHVDPTRIVLAGDSAGAQLSSQLAALVTDPGYARELDIAPALRPEQLRGVVLNCGIYEVDKMAGGSGIVGWGANQALWAYTGSRDFEDSTAVEQMSTMRHVTAQFPPTYISGGNGDPLTDEQSKPLATELGGLGVEVTTLFYPEDHEPALPHEYQFDLDNEDGERALERTVEFLKAHTAP
ncbi:alpha/beta hydrolase [Rhodococcus maanshanensis]|uniref:Acetyl esterase/lipase n=1 Tax=Rhodococcus maanshanensis TaxID=183556 RepID=A0A1H7SV45_9NOCA|nr:alpha/beta hydrolase [Rhodococcus maanshanensis]SEL76443.1 Acetyl esterase/lipase [Rhodococcus maanshanensis]